MQTIALTDYTIFIGDFWQNFNDFLRQKKYSKIAVLVDENTKRDCLPILRQKTNFQDFTIISIPSGEAYKTIQTCQDIWNNMMATDLERSSLTINLGGGVIGDMGGFCASTFKRGMDFIQMPTTLLSQVDASIGGKLGIDFSDVKNSIGIFKNPLGVYIDPTFLKTLPRREIRSGFAEIIKHSLIANHEQWVTLSQIDSLDDVRWEDYLKPSLLIKKRIVERDPFEKGLRKALNFGHTIGHAVESWALKSTNPLLHGEAIAIGMICETWLSHKIIGLPFEKVEEIASCLLRLYDAYELNESAFHEMIRLMQKDKKNENQQINFSLINPIGAVTINQTCDKEMILESMAFYNNLVQSGLKVV